jgi:hypothetical protein
LNPEDFFRLMVLDELDLEVEAEVVGAFHALRWPPIAWQVHMHALHCVRADVLRVARLRQSFVRH